MSVGSHGGMDFGSLPRWRSSSAHGWLEPTSRPGRCRAHSVRRAYSPPAWSMPRGIVSFHHQMPYPSVGHRLGH